MSIFDINIDNPSDILNNNINKFANRYFAGLPYEFVGMLLDPNDRTDNCKPFDYDLLDYNNLKQYIIVYKVTKKNGILLWITTDKYFNNCYDIRLTCMTNNLSYRMNLEWVINGNYL